MVKFIKVAAYRRPHRIIEVRHVYHCSEHATQLSRAEMKYTTNVN